MSTENKPNEKLGDKKSKVMKKSARVSPTTIMIVGLLTAMIGLGVYLATGGTGNALLGSGLASAEVIKRISVTDPVDYTKERVDMTNITYETEGDFVKLSLDDVIKNKLSRFEFEFEPGKPNEALRNFAGVTALPVMAFIDPGGLLMVGVSYCEPCRNTTFHTKPDLSLNCNKCGTKWDLTTLVPRFGACMPFPPDEIEVKVKDGQVMIPKDELVNWVPREET